MPRPTKKSRALELAASRGWVRIGEDEWHALRTQLPDISEATLRGCGLQIDAPWSGVSQHTFEQLEQSLRAFSESYSTRADLRRYCRDQVITAKDRARAAAVSLRVAEQKRAMKAEMVEWMLVWLDDPGMFPAWIGARRAAVERNSTGQ